MRKSVVSAMLSAALLAGCAQVPKEIVELSYVIGHDLVAIQSSYEQLITEIYQGHRERRRDYLDNVWYPQFLENWRTRGELVGIARGDRIWSDERSELIDTPSGTHPQESLRTLQDWVNYAIYAYRDKERELIEPLDQEESLLKVDVRQAFGNLIRANSVITAHLNSVAGVQAAHEDFLTTINLTEFRDNINHRIIEASERANRVLEDIRPQDQGRDEN